MIKITIPKPGKENEVEAEDGEKVETELSEDGVDVKDDLAKSIDGWEDKEKVTEEEEEAAPKETLDAKNDENGPETNEGNGDEVSVGEVEEGDGEEENKVWEEKAKSGAKSTTVIIARTHPGESNTSFIVQGQSENIYSLTA